MILGTGTEAVVRIWDVKSQANVASFEGHTGAVSCLAFSENGYYLATGAADATVKLWDLRKLKNFHSITPAAGGPIGGLHFDYTGQFLAVGSNDIRCVPPLTVASNPQPDLLACSCRLAACTRARGGRRWRASLTIRQL